MNFFALLVSFMICCVSAASMHAVFDIRDDQKVYISMQKAIKPIEKKYRMTSAGVGLAGKGEDGFWLLRIALERRGKELTKKEARRLITSTVDEFIAEINKDSTIKPFLRDFPVTHKNVSIIIVNLDDSGNDVYHPFIGGITAVAGSILYNTHEPNSYKDASEEEETYEQASAIVKGVH